MSHTALDDGVYVATIHRADAPSGRTARFHMRKLFDDLPCCHRSWANQDKRFFLHGCERTFEIEFGCAEIEPGTGLVVDTGTLNEVRSALRYQFDHTTLIADDDPQRDLFELLAERGVVDLRIMDSTGMEGSAAWVFDTAERLVTLATGGRVWVSRIEARESRNNVVTVTAGPGDGAGLSVAPNPALEEYAFVSDAAAIGCVGTLTVATRGERGAGEVLVTVRGSKEAFLAWSDDPLPRGAKVLVVDVRGARTVVVEPWEGLA
jgi:6-pyruvoyltetrahydropterin/6-carboxytetrahydropterin synthase